MFHPRTTGMKTPNVENELSVSLVNSRPTGHTHWKCRRLEHKHV